VTRLLVFDSGIGGLSVAREIRKITPSAEMVYIADDAAFPYGVWEAEALTDHIVDLMARLIETHAPDAVVIACNTASTLVLPPLRARFSIPFVGTVPGVKPAAEETKSGLVSVLATYGTIQRDYTRDLIKNFANGCDVRLVGSADLPSLAETYMRGGPVDDAAIATEIAPAFVEKDGRRTDVVVLACTHYPFLIEHFRRLAPWPVQWLDTAPAIARRASSVLGEPPATTSRAPGSALLTSGKAWPAALKPLLAEIGLVPGP
jgi:glutamate racemase